MVLTAACSLPRRGLGASHMNTTGRTSTSTQKTRVNAAAEYRGPSIVHDAQLWTPQQPTIVASGTGAPGEAAATSYDNHQPQTPPPDLPSLLLDSRIVYLGMPLVRRWL